MIGLVYGELPFMILPLYAVAGEARPLAARGLRRPRRRPAPDLPPGDVPLALPGLAAGIVLVFVPSLGQFVVSDLLGGASSMLLGNLIQNQFSRWPATSPFGAALAFELTAAVLLLLLGYAALARRRGGEELL